MHGQMNGWLYGRMFEWMRYYVSFIGSLKTNRFFMYSENIHLQMLVSYFVCAYL